MALVLRQYRFVRAKLLRLLAIKGRTAWIFSPACLAHFVNGEHPESPKRLEAIERVLRKSGLWHLLQKIEAPEVTDIQLSRVHTRKYLNSLENQIPSNGTVKIGRRHLFKPRHARCRPPCRWRSQLKRWTW